MMMCKNTLRMLTLAGCAISCYAACEDGYTVTYRSKARTNSFEDRLKWVVWVCRDYDYSDATFMEDEEFALGQKRLVIHDGFRTMHHEVLSAKQRANPDFRTTCTTYGSIFTLPPAGPQSEREKVSLGLLISLGTKASPVTLEPSVMTHHVNEFILHCEELAATMERETHGACPLNGDTLTEYVNSDPEKQANAAPKSPSSSQGNGKENHPPARARDSQPERSPRPPPAQRAPKHVAHGKGQASPNQVESHASKPATKTKAQTVPAPKPAKPSTRSGTQGRVTSKGNIPAKSSNQTQDAAAPTGKFIFNGKHLKQADFREKGYEPRDPKPKPFEESITVRQDAPFLDPKYLMKKRLFDKGLEWISTLMGYREKHRAWRSVSTHDEGFADGKPKCYLFRAYRYSGDCDRKLELYAVFAHPVPDSQLKLTYAKVTDIDVYQVDGDLTINYDKSGQPKDCDYVLPKQDQGQDQKRLLDQLKAFQHLRGDSTDVEINYQD